LLFALASVFLQKTQKVKHFGVCSYVDNSCACWVLLKISIIERHLFLVFTTLDYFVLYLLHQVKEFVKRNAAIRIRVNVLHKLSDFGGIALQTSHDGLEVSNIDVAGLVLVEEIEDLSQVCHLFICERAKALVTLCLVLLVIFNLKLSARKGWTILVDVINLLKLILAVITLVFLILLIFILILIVIFELVLLLLFKVVLIFSFHY
jgi:hypothetical protein